MITKSVVIMRGDESIYVDVDLELTYKGYKGRRPSLTQPGDPPEPPEFDCIKATAIGKDYNLTDTEESEACQLAMDAAIEDGWQELQDALRED
jgi:hypothetical protein